MLQYTAYDATELYFSINRAPYLVTVILRSIHVNLCDRIELPRHEDRFWFRGHKQQQLLVRAQYHGIQASALRTLRGYWVCKWAP